MTMDSVPATRLIGASMVVFLSLVGCSRQEPEAAAPPPITVEVQNLDEGTLQSSDEFVGSLEATQRVSLASRVDGRIVEIAKNEGERVRQGDLIVQLQLKNRGKLMQLSLT